MKATQWEPGSSIEAARDINTEAGRRILFNERVDDLMRPPREGERGLTLHEAIIELRLSTDPDDLRLLALMGATLAPAQRQMLEAERFNQHLDAQAKQNAKGTEPSAEVAAAAAAMNARNVAFNSRLDELLRPDHNGRALTLDQALRKMRTDPKDTALLDAMNAEMVA